jgi:hypothetical protein
MAIQPIVGKEDINEGLKRKMLIIIPGDVVLADPKR